MSDRPGADLARQALRQAKAAARTQATTGRRAPVGSRIARGSGRDPLKLGTVLDTIATNEAWKTGTQGGTVIDQWPAICPELTGKATAEHFDGPTGTLHLRPASPAFAAHLRLFSAQLAHRVNQALGERAVARIRVLAPRPAPARTGQPAEPPAQPPDRPAHREPVTPSVGFQRARAALDAARTVPAASPERALADRYFAATRGSLCESDTAFREAAAFQEDAIERETRAGDREALALARAREEKAGRWQAPQTAFRTA